MTRTLLALTTAVFGTTIPSTLRADFKPEVKFAEVNGVKLAY